MLLDLVVELHGDIGARISVSAGPLTVPIVLSNVFSRVVVRVELGPPVSEVPPIEGIKVGFAFLLACSPMALTWSL